MALHCYRSDGTNFLPSWSLWSSDGSGGRKTMREVVWSWGSEFSFGHVWDTYLNQREMLNRRLDM